MTAKMQVPGGETGTGRPSGSRQLRPAVDDGRRGASRTGRQGKSADRADQQPALRDGLRTAQNLKVQEIVIGRVQQIHRRGTTRQIAFYWISLHDGRPPAFTVAHPEPRPRRVFRPGGRQPDSQNGRAESPLGGRPACRRHWRGQGPLDSRRHAFQQRPVPVGADDARPRSGPGFRGHYIGQSTPPQVDGLLEHKTANGLTPWAAKSRCTRWRATSDRILVRLAQGGGITKSSSCPCRKKEPAEKGRLWGIDTDFILAHAHCPVFLAAAPVIPAEVAD